MYYIKRYSFKSGIAIHEWSLEIIQTHLLFTGNKPTINLRTNC